MGLDRKQKLIRVLQILQDTDEKTPINTNDIIKKLEVVYDIEHVNRSSIYRDITMLETCGYPICQCSDKRKGWYIKQHPLDDWEIKIIMDSMAQASCLSVEEAEQMQNKLVKLTSDRGRKRFAHMMTAKHSNADTTEHMGHSLELILEAVYQHRKIEFKYTKRSNDMKKVLRNHDRYTLSVFTIYWSADRYYLLGVDNRHEGMVHYRLDRMMNLQITEEEMVDAKKMLGSNAEALIQNYIDISVRNFTGEGIQVKLRYHPTDSTNNILYDFAGKDLITTRIDDELYSATFRKADGDTLVAWFLKYVDRFEVMEPESVRDKVKEKLVAGIEKYDK